MDLQRDEDLVYCVVVRTKVGYDVVCPPIRPRGRKEQGLAIDGL